MMGQPERCSVCHVVNAVGDTSMPGDLATAQSKNTHFRNVGVLAWFDINPFEGDTFVDTHCLNIPDTANHITPNQYAVLRDALSEYDIVHTHHNHSGFFAKLVAARLGKPIVVTDHNNHGGFTTKGRIATALTNPVADRIICVSESVRDSIAWWERILIKNDKISVINNGVDIGRVKRAASLDWSVQDAVTIDPEAVLISSAGELCDQKAHDVLINAVDQANNNSDRPIELVVSGGGNRKEDLEEQIRRATHSNRLHLLGFLEKRDQVYKMMHESDIYAMPSRWEGFCVAALEAMAANNACVFSDIPEFQKPFKSVARFHAVDNPSALADQLIYLASHPEQCVDLAHAGQKLVRSEFPLSRTVKQYVNHYSEVS